MDAEEGEGRRGTEPPRGDAPGEGPRFATVGRRALARVVAWVGLSLAASFLLVLLEPSFRVPFNELYVAVELALIARLGWDVGKLPFGLRVVGADGSAAGWGRATLRTLVLWGPNLALVATTWVVEEPDPAFASVLATASVAWWLLVAWSIATEPEHRGWHDRIAGTWVLDDPDPPGVAPPRLAQRASGTLADPGSQVPDSGT